MALLHAVLQVVVFFKQESKFLAFEEMVVLLCSSVRREAAAGINVYFLL